MATKQPNNLEIITLDNKLTLLDNSEHPPLTLTIDFLSTKNRQRRKKATLNNELLTKALALKKVIKDQEWILDLTAGLGQDSFLIASMGVKVVMLERSKIVAKLLQDALKRAAKFMQIKKMDLTLQNSDAKNYLTKLKKDQTQDRPFAIYIDPMYPTRKKSALNKQDLRVLAKVVGKNEDADQLLALALEVAKNRVVVKRPRIASFLADLKPNFSYEGKAIRFDVYLVTKKI